MWATMVVLVLMKSRSELELLGLRIMILQFTSWSIGMVSISMTGVLATLSIRSTMKVCPLEVEQVLLV